MNKEVSEEYLTPLFIQIFTGFNPNYQYLNVKRYYFLFYKKEKYTACRINRQNEIGIKVREKDKNRPTRRKIPSNIE